MSLFIAGTGTRLYRGYPEEARMEDKQADVTRLVFVVHGIGQKYNQNRIISCCNEWVKYTSCSISSYFSLSRENYSISFLEIQVCPYFSLSWEQNFITFFFGDASLRMHFVLLINQPTCRVDYFQLYQRHSICNLIWNVCTYTS